MGLLSQGTPLDWEEAKKYADYIRHQGIQQFLACYRRNKDAGKVDTLLWGDEVEYTLLRFDHESKKVALSLRGYDVLTELMQEEHDAASIGSAVNVLWRPEYARYMLEATPGSPYGLKASELSKVELNMTLRRKAAEKYLNENEFLCAITCFPLLGVIEKGVATCFYPPINLNDGKEHMETSQSHYIPDVAINPHPRFKTLTANIRKRRGAKVSINLPLYKDEKTLCPFIDPALQVEYESGAALPNHIYMDAMCFGMGCSCLQVTLQASQLCEARTLYDQLAVIAPIALALSAGAPIFRGYLADVDCRWNVIAASVDDRTRQERALEPLTSFKTLQWDGESFKEKNITSRIIPKSRYDSVSTFLAPTGEVYNDIPLVINSEIETTLLNAKVDPMLSKHLSHLFIRDPLVIYSELLNQDCEMATDHFENIQSTNWQTMRLKPPSNASPELGWRVEFRPMELQMTDFENAAFSVFLILLSRLILCYELNFYIPISLVDVNMQTAQKRDAVLNGHFWFRKIQVQPFTDSEFIENKKDCNGCSSFAPRSRSSSPAFKNAPSPVISLSSSKENTTSNEDFWALMSMNEIINGSSQTTGLIPMIRSFLDTLIVEDEVRLQINAYLEFISDRAAGKIATNANWIRQFVMKHPHYAKDSRVDSTLVYDLLCEIQKISQSNKSIRVAPVKFP